MKKKQSNVMKWCVLVKFFLHSFTLLSQNLSHDEIVPFDPNVKVGHLPNGFTYFIRKKDIPQGELDIYFVVKAGADQEDNDQLELAHTLEHMPFAGTKHFSNPRAYFQEKGLKGGEEINASTGANSTLYQLNNIPSHDLDLVYAGLLFMRDVAKDMTLDSLKIENERNVRIQEMISAGAYGPQTFIRFQYMNSVIGNPSFQYQDLDERMRSLAEFEQASLVRFYQDWYRPELQAIIVEGDIDVGVIEHQIHSLFSDLSNPPNPRQEKIYSSFRWDNKVLVLTHEKQQGLEVQIFMKRLTVPRHTVADYRYYVKTQLLNKLLENRFLLLNNNQTVPFKLITSFFDNRFNQQGPDFGALVTSIQVDEGSLKEGFASGITELERVKRHGFTEQEWEQVRDQWLQDNLQLRKYRGALDLIDYFVESSIAPSSEYEQVLLQQLVEAISLEEVNTLANEFISDMNRDIIVMAPEKLKSTLPDEVTVLGWVKEVQTGDVDPYKDQPRPKELMVIKELMSSRKVESLPDSSSYSKTIIKDIGVTRILLSNGMEVLLKPMAGVGSEKGKVRIRGTYAAGYADYSQADRLLASQVPTVVMRSGLGELSQLELKQFWESKQISIASYILDQKTEIQGGAPVDNIEDFLQALHLYFIAPQMDEEVYKAMVDELKEKLGDPRRGIPDYLYRYYVRDSIHNSLGISRRPWFTMDDVSKMNIERGYAIYERHFGNAGVFRFVITGDFSLKQTIPLVIKYLGSLPSTSRREPFREVKAHVPERRFRREIYKGKLDNLADVEIRFWGTFKENIKNEITLEVMEKVLNILLRKRLRETMGGTYGVQTTFFKVKSGVYVLYIQFECAADNVDNMIRWTQEEVDTLTKKGIEEEILRQAKGVTENQLQKRLMDSNFWVDYLSWQFRGRENITAIRECRSLIDQLTGEDVKKAARKYLKWECSYELIVFPECATSSSIKK